ncbi:MAG: hypothetical protein L0Z50_26360, partial [Verrucomicrobiales bacterium]|nr:hypothetical protein [Verrucomicrobiales bacterium]
RANLVRTANRPGSQRVPWKKAIKAFKPPRTFGALRTGTVRGPLRWQPQRIAPPILGQARKSQASQPRASLL